MAGDAAVIEEVVVGTEKTGVTEEVVAAVGGSAETEAIGVDVEAIERPRGKPSSRSRFRRLRTRRGPPRGLSARLVSSCWVLSSE